MIISKKIIDNEEYDTETYVGFNESPDYLTIKFKMKLYNNTDKTSGINNCNCFLKTKSGKYKLNYHGTGFTKLINIEPHKYIEESIYNQGTVYLEKNVVNDMKDGCTIYLEYNINGKRKIRKKELYKR